MTKIGGSGSISQRHGSADPDPHQNAMDPEHWQAPMLLQGPLLVPLCSRQCCESVSFLASWILDPDPSVRRTNPAPDPSISKQKQ
jgi:hypothetical protein